MTRFLIAIKNVLYCRLTMRIIDALLLSLAIHSILTHYHDGGYLQLSPIIEVTIVKPIISWIMK